MEVKTIILSLVLLMLVACLAATENITLNTVDVAPATAYINNTVGCYANATSNQSSTVRIYYDVYLNATNQTPTGHAYWTMVANGTNASVVNITPTVKGQNISCSMWAQSVDTAVNTSSNRTSNVTINNSNSTVFANITSVNATAGHWFVASFTFKDMDNASDMNVSMSTNGTCSLLTNTSSGLYLTTTYNCTDTNITTTLTPIWMVARVNDSSHYGTNTSNVTNTPPNQYPVVTTQINSTSCAAGHCVWFEANATDADGDVVNISAVTNTTGTCINSTNTSAAGYYYRLLNCSNSSSIVTTPNVSVMFTFNDTYGATVNSTNLTVAYPNQAPFIDTNNTFVNATTTHWFTVMAKANDTDGAGDIKTVAILNTSGPCAQLSNSSSGNRFTVTYNCSAGTPFVSNCIQVNFTDVTTSVLTPRTCNAYPNNAPTGVNLTHPNSTQLFYNSSNATANISAMNISWTNATDTDGDALTYSLYYSPDNGTTWVLINASAINYTVWDASNLTTLSTYLIRVNASDGYNISTNTTAADITLLTSTSGLPTAAILGVVGLTVIVAAYAYTRTGKKGSHGA